MNRFGMFSLLAFLVFIPSKSISQGYTVAGSLTTSAFQERVNTLGQKTMANSTPVVLSSDQSAIPITSSIDSPNQPARDAFQRVRMSSPVTVFDSKTLSDNLPLIYDDQQTSGSGTTSTFSANRASVTLAVSASTAGTRVRQTFQRFNYQPGKSQLVLITGIIGTGSSGITKRFGLFDDSNGLFF